MERSPNDNGNNRRTFIKNVTAISAGLVIPVSTATANPSDEKKRKAEQRKFAALSEKRTDMGTDKFHKSLQKLDLRLIQ